METTREGAQREGTTWDAKKRVVCSVARLGNGEQGMPWFLAAWRREGLIELHQKPSETSLRVR